MTLNTADEGFPLFILQKKVYGIIGKNNKDEFIKVLNNNEGFTVFLLKDVFLYMKKY